MEKLKVTGNYAHAVECEGHPTLIFDNSTNVCVVVYLTITSTDGLRHPFTLLITDESEVDNAIKELIASYGNKYASVDVLEPLYLKPYSFSQSQK